LLGEPDNVQAMATHVESGVHGQLAALLQFPDGAQATLTTTMLGVTPSTFTVVGSHGSLTIDSSFHLPGGLTVHTPEGTTHRWEGVSGSHIDGLHFQAAALARAVQAGWTETEEWPLHSSILALTVADELRRRSGIPYESPPITRTALQWDHI
jgi:predicted dehydrogenase